MICCNLTFHDTSGLFLSLWQGWLQPAIPLERDCFVFPILEIRSHKLGSDRPKTPGVAQEADAVFRSMPACPRQTALCHLGPVTSQLCRDVHAALPTCRSPLSTSFSRLPGLVSICWILDGSAGSTTEPSQPPHTTQGFMARPTLLEEDGLVLGLTMESCHTSPGFCSEPGMLRGRGEGGSKAVLEAPAHKSRSLGPWRCFAVVCA